MSEEVLTGLPTICLLPMNMTRFKVIGVDRLRVPRKGVYNEIAPEIFNADAGEFSFLDGNVLYLPAVTKVLLATGKYPALKDNQVFSPTIMLFEEDVVIIEGVTMEILNVVK